MSERHYTGVESLDPVERAKRRALTAALWAKLNEQGVRDGATGHIHGYFFTNGADDAARLASMFDKKPGWRAERMQMEGANARVRVKIETPELRLSKQALHVSSSRT